MSFSSSSASPFIPSTSSLPSSSSCSSFGFDVAQLEQEIHGVKHRISKVETEISAIQQALSTPDLKDEDRKHYRESLLAKEQQLAAKEQQLAALLEKENRYFGVLSAVHLPSSSSSTSSISSSSEVVDASPLRLSCGRLLTQMTKSIADRLTSAAQVADADSKSAKAKTKRGKAMRVAAASAARAAVEATTDFHEKKWTADAQCVVVSVQSDASATRHCALLLTAAHACYFCDQSGGAEAFSLAVRFMPNEGMQIDIPVAIIRVSASMDVAVLYAECPEVRHLRALDVDDTLQVHHVGSWCALATLSLDFEQLNESVPSLGFAKLSDVVEEKTAKRNFLVGRAPYGGRKGYSGGAVVRRSTTGTGSPFLLLGIHCGADWKRESIGEHDEPPNPAKRAKAPPSPAAQVTPTAVAQLSSSSAVPSSSSSSASSDPDSLPRASTPSSDGWQEGGSTSLQYFTAALSVRGQPKWSWAECLEEGDNLNPLMRNTLQHSSPLTVKQRGKHSRRSEEAQLQPSVPFDLYDEDERDNKENGASLSSAADAMQVQMRSVVVERNKKKKFRHVG